MFTSLRTRFGFRMAKSIMAWVDGVLTGVLFLFNPVFFLIATSAILEQQKEGQLQALLYFVVYLVIWFGVFACYIKYLGPEYKKSLISPKLKYLRDNMKFLEIAQHTQGSVLVGYKNCRVTITVMAGNDALTVFEYDEYISGVWDEEVNDVCADLVAMCKKKIAEIEAEQQAHKQRITAQYKKKVG